VLKYMDKIDVSKSAGPDNLHAKFIYELRSSLCEPLGFIFSKSLQEGKVPLEWKYAIVKPLFKKGDKRVVSNYRPVSLTSIVCKTLERIIRDNITEYLERNNLLSREQHGFRAGRSCASQLLEILELWTRFLDEGKVFDTVYLDFAKAFDKVPYERLKLKLHSYGIDGSLSEWLSDFLASRTQSVVINSICSDKINVTSGIPQGSVLSPLLFVIYINDLPDVVQSHIKIFADDTKIFRSIESSTDHIYMQEDLSLLSNWAKKWQLPFNVSKCNLIHYGGKNPLFDYNLNGEIIPCGTFEKDLGVTFDNSLKFTLHIRNMVAKANSRVGILKRNFSNLSADIFLPLYKSLVRPILEYCCIIWFPLLKTDAIEIEKVQRRATKLVPEISHLGYSGRLRFLRLDSLAFRRKRNDMLQVFKIIHKMDNLAMSDFFELSNVSHTRGHRFKLKKPRVNSRIRANSFAIRVINDWNDLKSETVTSTSLNSFKSALEDEWKNHPLKYYENI